ncbi:hypothetical protein M5X11_09035 [Paenibacillus alginolyticus]|uniref:hypothetical protein n=1 Tax=Paenibacillus alginolyticus TaxID=59839 RepID=UPI0003F79E90|nr:hypothetical protein [Paenibacillus alginolyticus]MCY9665101.1 hypothetical protein [Paenibacillus alginolyticus]
MIQQEIVFETLESMKDYVPKLKTASSKLAQDIQTHEGGWVDTLVAYLDGMAWLMMAINGIQQVNPEILVEWDLNLAPLIEQLGTALEQEDFVTLCDILQYEMQPLLQSFDSKLQGIVH